jgi:hypothetical protein
MKDIANNKTVVMGVLICVLAFLLYKFFLKTEVLPESVSSTQVGEQLLQVSANLSQTTLDRSLFTQPGFRLLSDFSTPIVEQPLGRPNPFAVIGRD